MVLVSKVEDKGTECTAHFSNGTVMDFTTEELCSFHIYEGREYEDDAFGEIISKVLTERAKAKVIGSVLYSPKTSGQVRDRILREGFSTETADALVEELVQKGYINDYAYAEGIIRKAIKSKPESILKITVDLKNKGISDEIIREAIKNNELDEEELATRALEKKLRTSREKEYNKLYSFLMRKGFTADAVRKAMKNCNVEKNNEY